MKKSGNSLNSFPLLKPKFNDGADFKEFCEKNCEPIAPGIPILPRENEQEPQSTGNKSSNKTLKQKKNVEQSKMKIKKGSELFSSPNFFFPFMYNNMLNAMKVVASNSKKSQKKPHKKGGKKRRRLDDHSETHECITSPKSKSCDCSAFPNSCTKASCCTEQNISSEAFRRSYLSNFPDFIPSHQKRNSILSSKENIGKLPKDQLESHKSSSPATTKAVVVPNIPESSPSATNQNNAFGDQADKPQNFLQGSPGSCKEGSFGIPVVKDDGKQAIQPHGTAGLSAPSSGSGPYSVDHHILPGHVLPPANGAGASVSGRFNHLPCPCCQYSPPPVYHPYYYPPAYPSWPPYGPHHQFNPFPGDGALHPFITVGPGYLNSMPPYPCDASFNQGGMRPDAFSHEPLSHKPPSSRPNQISCPTETTFSK